MKRVKITLTLIFFVPIFIFGQVNITPYISAGVANHLIGNGLNYELGIESEFFKRADITLNYRHMNVLGQVRVSAVSANISFVVINRNNHRLMLGPGLSYGKYTRETGTPGYDKEYTSMWFDWGKIQYDYTVKSKYRFGIKVSLSGEDGDGSTFIGLVIGYKL